MSSQTEQLLYPYPWYQSMRETKPISFNESYYSWSFFRYADVQRVLLDYENFSSQFMGGGSLSVSLISTDPPRHRQLRSLVTQAFTPRTVARLEPRITAIVHELLDRVAAQGKMDVIDDLAYPLPVTVIAELLGVPVEDREQFKHWSDMVVGSEETAGHAPQREMGMYFLQLLAQRRREPREDLLSALLAAQVDGEHLSEQELLGFCILLLVAGNVTTTNLIGNAFLCFDEAPEALAQLYADPSLIPGAIEEVLRYRSPVRLMYRVAAKDTVFEGHQIKEGQYVLVWLGSANRDETEFSEPDRFDPRRSPNRHLGFGHGIHYCLGAPLARLEAKIALTAMLERFHAIKKVPDTMLEPISSSILHGVRHFPVTFSLD